MIEAALIAGTSRSPSTIASAGQREVGQATQPQHGAPHGEHAGPEDVQPVDLGDRGGADADPRDRPQRGGKRFSLLAGQNLGIGQAIERPQENNGGGDHRPGEGPTARLVDPGDQPGAG
jgi:hypothetical protein